MFEKLQAHNKKLAAENHKLKMQVERQRLQMVTLQRQVDALGAQAGVPPPPPPPSKPHPDAASRDATRRSRDARRANGALQPAVASAVVEMQSVVSSPSRDRARDEDVINPLMDGAKS